MPYLTEVSDPDQPIQYTGRVLMSNVNRLQEWVVMDTDSDGECLFINQQLQSCIRDEAIYHELMVHGLLSGIKEPVSVLILGGAEGCMMREVLRWKTVKFVRQVDWDESLVTWFGEQGTHWNKGAYEDPRASLISEDALTFLRENQEEKYDAIFVDLLDPHTEEDLKFMKDILHECKRSLKIRGGICVNAGLVKKGAATPACDLAKYMKQEFREPGFHRIAYKMNIPSYLGEWGFLLATSRIWSSFVQDIALPEGLKHFSKEMLVKASQWSPEYPAELRDYWKSGGSWASIATAAATKKLTEPKNEVVEIDIRNHYGC